MSGLSLGIGLTNACDRSCAHCYRPQTGTHYLSLDDVVRCLETFDVGSVNLGTGENILNPALPAVLDELHRRGIRTSLTSNGLTLSRLERDRLERLHDVEVSFDFATRSEMDAFRGPGAWDSAVAAVERCVGMGLKVTLLAVLMRSNHDRLVPVARLATDMGALFRVNVYQPVHEGDFAPTWTQFWEGFRRLFAETRLVTCTEPVVASVLDTGTGETTPAGPCGCGRASIRLTPTAEILPCVYWPEKAAMLWEISDGAALLDTGEFRRIRTLPGACEDCPLLSRCGGGCPARRALTHGIDAPDPYCPMLEGEPVKIEANPGPDVELLHAANVCTTIVC